MSIARVQMLKGTHICAKSVLRSRIAIAEKKLERVLWLSISDEALIQPHYKQIDDLEISTCAYARFERTYIRRLVCEQGIAEMEKRL